MDKLTENIITLRYIQEDYGMLVDVAIDAVLETVEKLKTLDYQLALNLSSLYENEGFWEKRKAAAIENFLEIENS